MWFIHLTLQYRFLFSECANVVNNDLASELEKRKSNMMRLGRSAEVEHKRKPEMMRLG